MDTAELVRPRYARFTFAIRWFRNNLPRVQAAPTRDRPIRANRAAHVQLSTSWFPRGSLTTRNTTLNCN